MTNHIPPFPSTSLKFSIAIVVLIFIGRTQEFILSTVKSESPDGILITVWTWSNVTRMNVFILF